jgi:sarcosine oxidase subunit gamma
MAEAAFENPARRSPLHDLECLLRDASKEAGESIQLQEVPFLAQINLRGDAGAPEFRKAVYDVVGFELPVEPNTTVVSGLGSALWLGPDEWLLVGAPDTEEDLVLRLRQHLQGVHSSVVNVSDVRAVIELSGTRSRELLAKGCSLDLRPRSFRAGHCAQTVLAHASVLLQSTDAAPVWRLYVRNSVANYLATWLLDAIAEFRAAERHCDLDLQRPDLFGLATASD